MYSTIHGEVEFVDIYHNLIRCKCSFSAYFLSFYSDGRWVEHIGECVIFPSKDQIDWSKFYKPFKDGDNVIDIADGCPGIIDEMKWDEDVCDMKYYVIFGKGIDFGWYTNDTIKFYQPENSKNIVTTVNETQPKRDIYASEFMITHMLLPETPHNVNDELEYKIIDGYEFDRVENDKIILKVVKHKYPTTYEECCKVLGYDDRETYCICHTGTNERLFENLYHLKVYRDAYWKIAGEELGLGKPWEPDWNNHNQHKFGIHNVQNNICLISLHVLKNLILVFPTEEMRDAFYENFKDFIEQCKELL